MRHSSLPAVLLAAFLAVAVASPSRCILRPNPGPCKAKFERYFWDSISGTCKPFTWGGCNGVVPFKTLVECQKENCNKKRCLFPGITGPCKALFTKYYYNPILKKCQTFTWGGCRGLVPFNTLAECQGKCEPDPCKEKPAPGPCLALFNRYFFDAKSKTCKSFVWGGCQGNVPFKTLAACQKRCPVVDRCKLKPEVGPCRARLPRYYFDQRSKSCKLFFWGGCRGTVPFNTLRDCEKSCHVIMDFRA